MFYNATQKDELTDKDNSKNRIRLRRDINARGEILSSKKLTLDRLKFDERKIIASDEQSSADLDEARNKLEDISNEIRMMEETIKARQKSQRNLISEIGKLERKSRETRMERENISKNMEKISQEMRSLENEVKRLNNEVKETYN